jgi:hypothetical protein
MSYATTTCAAACTQPACVSCCQVLCCSQDAAEGLLDRDVTPWLLQPLRLPRHQLPEPGGQQRAIRALVRGYSAVQTHAARKRLHCMLSGLSLAYHKTRSDVLYSILAIAVVTACGCGCGFVSGHGAKLSSQYTVHLLRPGLHLACLQVLATYQRAQGGREQLRDGLGCHPVRHLCRGRQRCPGAAAHAPDVAYAHVAACDASYIRQLCICQKSGAPCAFTLPVKDAIKSSCICNSIQSNAVQPNVLQSRDDVRYTTYAGGYWPKARQCHK